MVRSLQDTPPLSEKPDYTAYCDYLESRGWRREQITLDELNTNLVTLFGLAATNTGTVIDVRAPAGQKISIMGTQQIPRGADARSAHALRIRLANTADTEISLITKIRITKEKTSEAIVQLARVFYADVNMAKNAVIAGVAPVSYKTDLEWYRFKQGVELNGEQHLKIICVAPDIAVSSSFIKFALDLDLWTREE